MQESVPVVLRALPLRQAGGNLDFGRGGDLVFFPFQIATNQPRVEFTGMQYGGLWTELTAHQVEGLLHGLRAESFDFHDSSRALRVVSCKFLSGICSHAEGYDFRIASDFVEAHHH